MNVQQLQPTFTQSQFTSTQSVDSQTSQVTETNTNQSAQSGTQPNIDNQSNIGNQPVEPSAPTLSKGWNQSNQAPADLEQEPVMDICTDDAFVGGSCLRLEADVVHSKFIKYR